MFASYDGVSRKYKFSAYSLKVNSDKHYFGNTCNVMSNLSFIKSQLLK